MLLIFFGSMCVLCFNKFDSIKVFLNYRHSELMLIEQIQKTLTCQYDEHGEHSFLNTIICAC